MDIIEKTIRENRPNITDSSVKTYTSIISNLYKKMNNTLKIGDDVKDFFCENVDEVIEFLQDKPPANRKTTTASLVVFCDDEEAKKKYREIMIDDKNKVKNENMEQKLTEKQKENWVSQDELKNIYNQLEKEGKALLLKDKLTKREFQHIQDYVILSLYVLIEPRRLLDYTEMKIDNYDKDKDNYYEKNKFVFNVYKTAKHFGKQEIPIPKKLSLLLNKFNKFNPTDYLLIDVNNNKLAVSQLQQRLNKILGRKASVNILRHSFLTEKYKDVPELKEMVKTANNMGQASVYQALEYVKKK